jgi:hypothetical protein
LLNAQFIAGEGGVRCPKWLSKGVEASSLEMGADESDEAGIEIGLRHALWLSTGMISNAVAI